MKALVVRQLQRTDDVPTVALVTYFVPVQRSFHFADAPRARGGHPVCDTCDTTRAACQLLGKRAYVALHHHVQLARQTAKQDVAHGAADQLDLTVVLTRRGQQLIPARQLTQALQDTSTAHVLADARHLHSDY